MLHLHEDRCNIRSQWWRVQQQDVIGNTAQGTNAGLRWRNSFYLMIVLYSRGVHGLDFGFFESRLLLPRTGSWVRFSLPQLYWVWILCLLKNITGCLLDLYICGVKQESDCLFHVGAESGADSDWKLTEQDWIRIQKNRSPHTSADNRR